MPPFCHGATEPAGYYYAAPVLGIARCPCECFAVSVGAVGISAVIG